MKLSFTPVNDNCPIPIPADQGALDCVAPKGWRCTSCGGFKIHGCGRTIESYDTFAADAKCTGCGAIVGVLRAKVSTLFGLAEDERVLNSYPKIY